MHPRAPGVPFWMRPGGVPGARRGNFGVDAAFENGRSPAALVEMLKALAEAINRCRSPVERTALPIASLA
jgi:hypothetical protein